MADAGKKDQKGGEGEKVQAYRDLIGRAIIDGLLIPGFPGPLQDYNQGNGGYWQSDGGSHTQGAGDYHQGSSGKVIA